MQCLITKGLRKIFLEYSTLIRLNWRFFIKKIIKMDSK